MTAGLALVFPGQGAHDVAMLEAMRAAPAFATRMAVVADALGGSPLVELERRGAEYLNRNKVTALFTVLASSLALDRFHETGERAEFVAGYSVGQWSALHAAGALSFERLVEVVAARCDAMDACFEETPGAMLAVFGLMADVLDRATAELRDLGHPVWVSNHNAPGQCTVAGTAAAIAAAEAAFAKLSPRKLTRIPVSGAWHTPLLGPARDAFAPTLARLELAPRRVPVVDDVTGGLLPDDPAALREALALHLDHAVRWEQGIRTLIARGATRFVEIGWGKVLTKFGMFIDRSVTHEAFSEF